LAVVGVQVECVGSACSRFAATFQLDINDLLDVLDVRFAEHSLGIALLIRRSNLVVTAPRTAEVVGVR